MTSPFDGAGKPFKETGLGAAIVVFVVAVAIAVAIYMAPALLPEPEASPGVQSTVPNVEGPAQ